MCSNYGCIMFAKSNKTHADDPKLAEKEGCRYPKNIMKGAGKEHKENTVCCTRVAVKSRFGGRCYRQPFDYIVWRTGFVDRPPSPYGAGMPPHHYHQHDSGGSSSTISKRNICFQE